MDKRLLLALLLASLSFSTITGMLVSGTIDPEGSTALAILANFSQSEGKQVMLNVSGPLSSVTVKDRSGLVLKSIVKSQDNNTLIFVTVPTDYLEYDISSDSLTTKSGNLWDFDLLLSSSENITSFGSTIDLPKGTVLDSTSGQVSGTADSLSISWVASDIDTSHRVHLKAGYSLQTLPSPQNLTTYAIIAAFIVVILAYIIRKPSAPVVAQIVPPEPNKLETNPVLKTSVDEPNKLESNAVFKTLDETDKEIIREIASQNGKTTQAYLYMHTHIPKATLSRRIASLTNKGIIQKSQKGNRNLVSLTDLLKK